MSGISECLTQETVNGHRLKIAYADVPNMGDQLNPLILKKCFGYECECVRAEDSEISGIGSHLEKFVDGWMGGRCFIWGTGFIRDNVTVSPNASSLEFCAIRGSLSKKKIEDATGRKIDSPLADPGLLAPMLLGVPVEKKFKVGIVPHFREQDDPSFNHLKLSFDNSIIIDVKNNPLFVVRQIAACEVIVSSSLHGLIVADAFGIPNLQIKVTRRPLGDGFKFRDYYSAYGLEPQVCDLSGGGIPVVSEIVKRYNVSQREVKTKQRQLVKSFPYPIHKLEPDFDIDNWFYKRQRTIYDKILLKSAAVNHVRIAKISEACSTGAFSLPDVDATARKQRQSGSCCLSVVIPCYNVEKYVRRCLESILVALCRLNKPAEVICVDDGSADGTVAEIEKISEEFRHRGFKIAILRQANQGAGVARNAGLSMAKGKYLHFCDADDWVESDIFVGLIDAAERAKAEIATCTRRIIRDDLTSTISGFFGPVNDLLKHGSVVISPEDISDSLFSFATQVPWNKIFSRRYINRMKLRFQEIPRANDVYFVCLALVHAKRIALVNRPLYSYHINEGSVTRDDSRAGACGMAFAAVRDRLVEDGLFTRFSDAFALMVFTGYRFYFKMFSSGPGLKRMYPSMRRSLLQLLPDGLGNSGLIHAFYRAEYEIIRRETLPTSLLLQYVRESMQVEAKMSRDRLDLQWQVQDLQAAVDESTAESAAIRENVGELRGYLKRKDNAISAKDASLESLRGATGHLHGVVEKQREAISAKDAALENLRGAATQLRGATVQLKERIERQSEAITAKDASLEKLRGAAGQLRGIVERQREAISAKDASLENLRGATGHLHGVVEKQREAISAKDAALENLRGAATQLRGATVQLKERIERQSEAITAKDAALENLHGAAGQLRGIVERQREAITAKDASLEKLRGATGQLRGIVERQREAITAKDAALENLRGTAMQLRGIVERQREAITAKDAELESLRGEAFQLEENLEKQQKTLVAKESVLKQQATELQFLCKETALKQQLLEQCQKIICELKGVVEL